MGELVPKIPNLEYEVELMIKWFQCTTKTFVNRERYFISIKCAATFATNSKSSRKSTVGVDGIVNKFYTVE